MPASSTATAPDSGRPRPRASGMGWGNGLAWLELAPATGRTHKLPATGAAKGCPVFAAPINGGEPSRRVPLPPPPRTGTSPLGGDRGGATVTAEPPEHM